MISFSTSLARIPYGSRHRDSVSRPNSESRPWLEKRTTRRVPGDTPTSRGGSGNLSPHKLYDQR